MMLPLEKIFSSPKDAEQSTYYRIDKKAKQQLHITTGQNAISAILPKEYLHKQSIITICDISGRSLAHLTTTLNDIISVPLPLQSPGIYFFIIRTSDRVLSKPFSIVK
jgi:hypothetical protein